MISTEIKSIKEELQDSIKSKTAVIGILGLGYVGLPLAIHFRKQGFRVIGFDVDFEKIEALNNDQSYIQHISHKQVKCLREENRFQATLNFKRLTEADCLIICVPTPLDEHRCPNLCYLNATVKTIAQSLRPGQLIVLESTTYPGTTEEVLLPTFNQTGLQAGQDYFLAFSPEREDPGNKNFNTGNTPKVVGGVTPHCLELAANLYRQITEVVTVSSTKSAEMTKLLENIFRCVNIALVNELKILCHKMNIDIFEVIRAASTKPFGFLPFYPGPGLGGHCIPIDPFYLTWKAQEFGMATRFIQLAGEINTAMPDYVIRRTMEAFNKQGKNLKGSRILILGIAYKPNIGDDRESPGYEIMESLIKEGADVLYNDPFVPRLKPTRKHGFDMKSTPVTTENLKRVDAVVIVTDHSAYDYDMIVRCAPLIVDTRNATQGINNNHGKIFHA